MIGWQVAEVLDLSLRQVRRLLAAYRKGGAQALAHGNRGRKPHHALNEGQRKQVLALAQSTYPGCNTQHFTELLAEQEGIALSRSSVRRILLQVGVKSPRKKRLPKHRRRRERYPKAGMLLQIDGSRHELDLVEYRYAVGSAVAHSDQHLHGVHLTTPDEWSSPQRRHLC